MAGDGSRFEAGVEAWVAGLGGPRDAVRQELVRGQLAEVMAGRGVPQRVLDVGCGQWTQSLLLARAGHEVVGLDPSADLLARFRAVLAGEPAQVRGRVRLVEGAGQQAPALAGAGFDVVLCHGVLMYLDDVAAMLTALTAAAAADGLVSLLVRNGMAPAMRPGLRGDCPAAIRAFDDPRYVNSLGSRPRRTPRRRSTAFSDRSAGAGTGGTASGCSPTTSRATRGTSRRSCSRPSARRAAATRIAPWRPCCT